MPVPNDVENMIREFEKRDGDAAFKKIERPKVAEQLRDRIEDPSNIDQGDSSLCGPAVFIYCLAIRQDTNIFFDESLYTLLQAHKKHISGACVCLLVAAHVLQGIPKGRSPADHWKELAIARENSYFGGFSPDSKWFTIRGPEFVHIFQTDPPVRIARLESDSKFTAVHVASNNLVVMGDREGSVQIFDVSSARVIAKHKVLAHGVWPVELAVDKGFLWAASTRFYLEKGEQSEIALYRVGGLEPYIEPQRVAKIK